MNWLANGLNSGNGLNSENGGKDGKDESGWTSGIGFATAAFNSDDNLLLV